MSEWKEQREAFYKIAIARGMTRPEELAEAFPLGHSLPPGKMEKWLDRFIRTPRSFASQRRYVNRFKLGADPEFVFTHPNDSEQRKDAQGFKLRQGPAFGADNNGRLAEIRPHPSRSAVEVCASILSTLRWMSILYPATMSYAWRAGAWAVEDGLGGHVHFGRKRPDRAREVAALDTIEETMLDAGLFSQEEQNRRRAGDSHRQLYGMQGDFRLQTHGYEYRTFPSWLNSPELAFLTITLSKLAVHDPNIIWKYTRSGPTNIVKLANLLRFYKDVDDDARLALIMVNRGVDVSQREDFKAKWGISPLGGKGSGAYPTIIPLSIKPSKDDVKEMFDYFYKGAPLVMKLPEPTWSPIGPPRGYRMLIDNCQTVGRKGIGELCWDICYSEQWPIGLAREQASKMTRAKPVAISRELYEVLPKNNFVLLPDGSNIWVDPWSLDHGRSSNIRKAMLSGVLPLWRVKDVRPESFELWNKNVRVKPKAKRYAGSWIVEEGKLPYV